MTFFLGVTCAELEENKADQEKQTVICNAVKLDTMPLTYYTLSLKRFTTNGTTPIPPKKMHVEYFVAFPLILTSLMERMNNQSRGHFVTRLFL